MTLQFHVVIYQYILIMHIYIMFAICQQSYGQQL